MCSKGSSSSPPVPSNESTAFQSATSPSAFMTPVYHNFVNQAQSLAQTPFNPGMYGQVAPLTANQQTAGQQMFDLGMNLGNFDPNAVRAIESPYTQDVVQATQDWFNNQNAIQGNDLMSQAIRSGNAFGGDRAGIAEARLAGQQQLAQAPVIAGLRQTGYTQALDEYNRLKQFGMAGTQAALGWGTMQQQQQQREMDVAQQNAMMASAYPFQQMNWLGSILGGIGPLTGSFTQGYNTPPSPDALSQGLGIASSLVGLGSSLFGQFDRGGVVRGLAGGGDVNYSAGYDDSSGEYDRDDRYNRFGSESFDLPPEKTQDSGDWAKSLSSGAVPIRASKGPEVAQMPSTQRQQQNPQKSEASQIIDLAGKAVPLFAKAFTLLAKRGGGVGHFADGGDDSVVSTLWDRGDAFQPTGYMPPPLDPADRAEMADIGVFNDRREGPARGSAPGLPVQEGGNYLARTRERFRPMIEGLGGQPTSVGRWLDANTTAEVGSSNQAARDAYQATVLDRAAARREALPFTLQGGVGPGQSRPYYPESTLNATRTSGIGVNPSLFRGANPANYGTGNASGNVGFAGGYQTASAPTGSGTERFGVEGRPGGADQSFVNRARGATGDTQVDPDQPSRYGPPSTGPSPQGRSDPYGPGDITTRQIPGLERQPKTFAQRWAENPLSQFGAALLARGDPNRLRGIGSALQATMGQQQQQAKQDVLDQKPQMITSAGTIQWRVGDKLIDTGIKTTAASVAEENRKYREAQLEATRVYREGQANKPVTIQTENGPVSAIRQADGSFRPVEIQQPQPQTAQPQPAPQAPAGSSPQPPTGVGSAPVPTPQGASTATESTEPASFAERSGSFAEQTTPEAAKLQQAGQQRIAQTQEPGPEQPPAQQPAAAFPAAPATAKPISTEPGGDRVTVDPPEPKPVRGTSPDAIKQQAEQYLRTGKLLPGVGRKENNALKEAITNYAADLAKSRGMTPQQVAEMWTYNAKHAQWIMGADGRTAGALGTLIDHLDTMRSLTAALQNGDNQTYNLIKNKVAKWTGQQYPTNVQAGAGIVGAEIMKAVGAAGAGTGVERETAGLNIGDLSKSPQQFAGAIETVERLAAGQLRTKYRQAEAIGMDKKRLEALVGPTALSVLNSLDQPAQGGGAQQPSAPAKPDVRQNGVLFRWNGTKYEAVQ